MSIFQVGKEYSTPSVCDHNCLFTAKIIKRAAKTVIIKMFGYEEKRCKITIYDGEETIKPLGSYSMSPMIRA